MITKCMQCSEEAYEIATDLFSKGEIAAFPTETVYGLGASAYNAAAAGKIFDAKGRPHDNPLIVHVAEKSMIPELVDITETGKALIDAFMPGPITVIMPRKSVIPDEVTAGLDTVGIRMPINAFAHRMLEVCKLPIAAPSANRSGRPSPTTALHVLEDMDGRIPLILDGGPCEVGLESTVVDAANGEPMILRPGAVTKEMIEKVCGVCRVTDSVLRPLRQGEKALSPGMRYRHYAPKGEMHLYEGDANNVAEGICIAYDSALAASLSPCILCFSEHSEMYSSRRFVSLGRLSNPEEAASRLFTVLRDMDRLEIDCIFCEMLPTDGMGLAVMNRLGRAASFQIVKV
ncbi:MAG: L-threonylcarbamoyladenylate synthase [Eubacteriales bacterium]|nr:L-threonylcarbamoyladenylate synthase [Eubacteriales bacterium]MDD3882080.1 L-threonylcarbamoyladenylate synthase [Eubacteriales bacterium]MDD4512527.1 L-threonylcarbamoyladenylate synthase [Eubacteriales bacterium]